jgi:hypothetical protein
VVESGDLRKSEVKDMESFLLKAAVIAPDSMDRICRILLDLQYRTGAVAVDRVGQRLKMLIEREIDKQHHYEVLWLLYTLRGLKWQFASKKLCSAMEQLPSAAISLVLLDMHNRGTMLGKLPTSTCRHSWLRDKNKLMNGALFRPMASRNVVFYDPQRNVMKSRSVVAKRRATRKRDRTELLKFFADLRHLGADEY